MTLKIQFNMKRNGLDTMNLYDDIGKELEEKLSPADAEYMLKLSEDEVIIDSSDVISYMRVYMDDIESSRLQTLVVRMTARNLEEDIVIFIDREKYKYSGFAIYG